MEEIVCKQKRKYKSVKYCCICKGVSRGQIVDGRQISLHRFPKDKRAKRIWTQRCKTVMPAFKWTEHKRLCSEHFMDFTGPTLEYTLPSRFPTEGGSTKEYSTWNLDENPYETRASDDAVPLESNETMTDDVDNDDDREESTHNFSITSECHSLDVSLHLHDYCYRPTTEQVGKTRCRIRILDCYGTEPAYNNQLYAVKHNKASGWGGQDLHTQQFWTMFPHSPDNSFVGFVVRQNYANNKDMGREKKDIALVYGKSLSLWKKKSEYLKVFHQNGLEVHSTIREDNKTGQHPAGMPDYVINHGVLNGTLFELLRTTKIFIGLGGPFEGPAPLEAIANGAVFVNPKFEPPLSYTKRGKPTERELTSQNPYVETYMGPPHVYTVEVKNLIEVDKTIKTILKNNTYKAFVPLEFTFEGYLQRISAYVAHQDFCHFDTQSWPPDSAVTVVMAKPGWSCRDTCKINDLVCEPSHFERINTKTTFLETLKIHCSKFRTQTDQVYPAVDLDLKPTCTLQNDRKLFSCVSGDKKVMRIYMSV